MPLTTRRPGFFYGSAELDRNSQPFTLQRHCGDTLREKNKKENWKRFRKAGAHGTFFCLRRMAFFRLNGFPGLDTKRYEQADHRNSDQYDKQNMKPGD